MTEKTKRDTFLKFTPAYMKVCLEDCCAADLGMQIDQDGLLSKYNVEENFSSFFKFYTDTYLIEIKDIVSDIEQAIACFDKDGQYFAASFGYLISTKNFQKTVKERWDLINIACMMYLNLPLNDQDLSEIIIVESNKNFNHD